MSRLRSQRTMVASVMITSWRATEQIFKYREIPDNLNERCWKHKVTSLEKNEVSGVQGFPLSRLHAVLIPKSKTDLTRRLTGERVMWNSSINLSSETT